MQEKEETKTENSHWVTTWSQAFKGTGLFPINDNQHTVQYEIPIQNTGETIKLTLGNYYSENPLKIGHVSVSKEKDGEYQFATLNGEEAFKIDPKGTIQTDELKVSAKQGESLFIRLYYPKDSEENRALSGNAFSVSADRSIKGDFSSGAAFESDSSFIDSFKDEEFSSIYTEAVELYQMRFTATIEGIDVQTEETGGTIVAFGDSITEQQHWVQPLQISVTETLGNGYSVVNAGISGNRLLKEIASVPRKSQYFGLAGVNRFEHDVYEVNSNVKAVIISLGVNDIHQPGTDTPLPVEELPIFDELKTGYEILIEQAKEHQSRVYLTTITPFIGYTVDVKNKEKEELRQKINTWIRENKEIDGIYDFDQAIADSHESSKLKAEYDSGDKLHPNEKGGAAMAELIDVKTF